MPSGVPADSAFLLAFTALFSIINPLGGAFLFLSATRSLGPKMRAQLALWVAIHAFIILTSSFYIGAYVLSFFGISLPVLRVAGGFVIAMAGWRMLNARDDAEPPVKPELPEKFNASRAAFYPLTMPLTTGPGTISVAVTLGVSRAPQVAGVYLLGYFGQLTLAALVICILVYLLYRYSGRISRVIGPTGTTIVMRLTAFLLLCIGVGVLWSGLAELLATLIPGSPTPH